MLAKGSSLTNKVAVIGLGSIRLGIAQTLLCAGFETIGCNRRKAVLGRFDKAGATPVFSPGAIDGDRDAVLAVRVGEETPYTAVDIFVKDRHIVQQMSAAEDFPLSIATAASQLLTVATPIGGGQLGDSAVTKVYESMCNIALPQSKETN